MSVRNYDIISLHMLHIGGSHLREGPIVPHISMVRETVFYKSDLTLFHVLHYWVQRLRKFDLQRMCIYRGQRRTHLQAIAIYLHFCICPTWYFN